MATALPLEVDQQMEIDDDCNQDTPGKIYQAIKEQLLMSPPSQFLTSGKVKQAHVCSPGESGYSSSYGENTSPFIATASGYGSDINTPASWQSDILQMVFPIPWLADTLTKNYKRIKSEFLPRESSLVDILYQHDILNSDKYEQIKRTRLRSRASDLFIKALHDKLSVQHNVESRIVHCFEQTGNRHLLEANTDTQNNKQHDTDLSEDSCKILSTLLKENKDVLLKGLEPKDVIDDLVENGMLRLSDHEDIYAMPTREERVQFLINHVAHNCLENSPKLIAVLQLRCPDIWDRFKERENMSWETGPAVRPLSIESCNRAQPELWQSLHTDLEIELKINITTAAAKSTDVEMAIVNHHSESGNPKLAEEVMEVCHGTVENITYSSIKINIRPQSKYSAKRLVEVLATNPQTIRQWLITMLPVGQLEYLKDNPLTKVTVEVNLKPTPNDYDDCRCILSQKTVEMSRSRLEIELKRVDYVITKLFQVRGLCLEQRKKLQEMFDMPNGVEKTNQLLTLLLTLPDEFMCLLEVSMCHTDQRELLNNILADIKTEEKERDDSTGTRNHTTLKKCTCVCSKEILVLLYSKLTSVMTDVDAILREITKYTSSNRMEDELENVKSMEPGELKTEQFLNLLLNVLPEHCICILENMLWKTRQHAALSFISNANQLLRDGEIQVDDIRENCSFIAEEIGPQQFSSILQSADQKLQEFMLSNSPRLDRSKAFVQYLVTEGSGKLGEFLKELNCLGNTDVLKILQSSRNSKLLEHARVKTDALRQQIMSNFDIMADEIEVKNIRTVFVERKVTSEKDFDDVIAKGATTKERYTLLMNTVMRNGYRAMVCFVDALYMAGYDGIEHQIRDTGEELQSHCTVEPLEGVRIIMEAEFTADNCTDIKDDLNDMNDGEISVSPLPENWNMELSSNVVRNAREERMAEIVVDNEEFKIQNGELESLQLLTLPNPSFRKDNQSRVISYAEQTNAVTWYKSKGPASSMQDYEAATASQNSLSTDGTSVIRAEHGVVEQCVHLEQHNGDLSQWSGVANASTSQNGAQPHMRDEKERDILEWINTSPSHEGSPIDKNAYRLNRSRSCTELSGAYGVVESHLAGDRTDGEEEPIKKINRTLTNKSWPVLRKNASLKRLRQKTNFNMDTPTDITQHIPKAAITNWGLKSLCIAPRKQASAMSRLHEKVTAFPFPYTTQPSGLNFRKYGFSDLPFNTGGYGCDRAQHFSELPGACGTEWPLAGIPTTIHPINPPTVYCGSSLSEFEVPGIAYNCRPHSTQFMEKEYLSHSSAPVPRQCSLLRKYLSKPMTKL